jgi:predicted nucleic acid-binding protein
VTIEPDNPKDHSELIVLDAGPILNFMGRNDTTDLYLKTLKAMTDGIVVPDAVVDEVEHKSGKDQRFTACRKKLLAVIGGQHISMLVTPDRHDDDEYEFHWSWVMNNCPKPMLISGKNRGEMVLVAHARVLQTRGLDVVAMIDDQDAVVLATKAGIPTFSTVQLFQESINHGLITDKAQLKKLYGFVQEKDDGLLPFKQTELRNEFSES